MEAPCRPRLSSRCHGAFVLGSGVLDCRTDGSDDPEGSTSTAESRGGIARFVGVTFLRTWPMWWTAALVAAVPAPLLSLLFLTGGLGPLAGAAWLLRGSSR
jgi:hypothetical protein